MRHIVFLFMAAVLLFMSACRKGRDTYAPENIDGYMVSLSAQAVERARSGYGVILDYSPESVKEVEKLLTMKYELQKTHPMTEQEMATVADQWGAYIGEVMKRMHPAHWERDSVAGGGNALGLVFDDTRDQSFPSAWVYHRLKNGEEDNVWTKFQFVTQPGGLRKYFPPKDKPAAGKNKNAPNS